METKVPYYSIVNIFLPGLVLTGICGLLFFNEIRALADMVTELGNTGLEVLVTVSLFAVTYKVGYIIFRVGAIIVEPILKKMFGWADYKDFIAAGKTSETAYEKLEMLSREYGYARTQITLCVTIVVLAIIRGEWWLIVCGVLCAVLFVFTAHGYMKKIQTAVPEYFAVNNRDGNK